MSLLDDTLKSALGGQNASGTQANSLVKSVLDLLNDQNGGGDALSRAFQTQGLGDVLSSWVGTGSNRSISAEQVTNVLGAGRVSDLAHRAGLSAAQTPSILAAVLPALIDKLTPDGQLPQQALLADRGKGLLESIGAAFGGGSGKGASDAPRPKADFSDVQGGSSSTAPPPAPAQIYVVVAGDSLSKIAKRFYANANDWRRIYDANRTVIGDNPDLIKPGQKLTIPKA